MREITSKDNSLIKYMAKLQSSAKLRREDKRFVSASPWKPYTAG